MAKFNIEVEIEGLNDEDTYIDDEIREQVIKGIENKLLEKSTKEAVKAVDKAIGEKIEEAKVNIDIAVEQFIMNVCEDKMNKIMIPYKESSWSSEIKYMTLSEYVGDRFEKFINEKRFDYDGSVARYDSDKKLSLTGLLVNKYLEKTLATRVENMIKKAQEESEEMVLKTLEQKLKENLATDTIKRMNIPQLLKTLEQKGIEWEEMDK